MVELEEQADIIETQMEDKARLIKQKNELNNLMRTVENNIEPKRFKALSTRGGAVCNPHEVTQKSVEEELLDFESTLPDPRSAKC